MHIEFDYHCPFCNKDTTVDVEVDSPSDYYFEDSCPECGAALDIKFSDNLPSEIASEMAGRAEYLYER